MPARRASAGERTSRDAACVGAYRAGQDLDQRGLARSVGSHLRVYFARQDGERRVAQRRDGAVVLRHTGGFEERVRRQLFRQRYGAGTAGVVRLSSPSSFRSHAYSPGPLQATICSLV